MNYIILDLEWNQSPDGKKSEISTLPFEILEIGAVKLDSQMAFVDTFHTLIHPQVYKTMHFHIQRVIGKTIEDFQNGLPFVEAVSAFLSWCGKDCQFCTWGSMDLTELQRNMVYYNIPIDYFQRPLFFYDVQKLFAISFEDRKTRRGLEFAIDFLSINKENSFHSALNDASYTAKILTRLDPWLIRSNYSIDCYLPPQSKKEEIYAVFETYSKYISREFDSVEKVLTDKEVTSTRCYLCGKPAKKKIRWFSYSNHHYYCQCFCEHHGWMKGKIHLKTSDSKQVFAIKILKLVSKEEADKIKQKQESVRKKRQLRRKFS